MSQEELLAALGEAARRLPPGQVAALADALEAHEAPTAPITEVVASPVFRDLAGRLVQAWQEEASTSGSAIALALRSTANAVERARAEESIEIVWTGPKTTAVPVRLTREVLIDLIRAARE